MTTTRLKNKWFEIFPNGEIPMLLGALRRAMAKDSHLYLFVDPETSYVVKPMAEAAGFRWWNDIIWDKCRRGMGYHYARSHEKIMFFERGKRALNTHNYTDVLQYQSLRGKQYSPAEKPVELLQVLVEQSSNPGDLVLDPFMGRAARARLRYWRVGDSLVVTLARKPLVSVGQDLKLSRIIVRCVRYRARVHLWNKSRKVGICRK